jgi:hypothetical protein
MMKLNVLIWAVVLWISGGAVGANLADGDWAFASLAWVSSAISFYAIKRLGEET